MALALIAALALVFLRSAIVAPDVADHMLVATMTASCACLSVRDWLKGQGWFDMSNGRVLPPEGVSLHWSRYVDLGIAGVISGAVAVHALRRGRGACAGRLARSAAGRRS
jgi:hypothetical protein